MIRLEEDVDYIINEIQQVEDVKRLLIAIAGAPGSGKSTLAAALVDKINNCKIGKAVLVPMDGFHLDNEELIEKGLIKRKGAPETFDVKGLLKLTRSIRNSTDMIRYPLFDRAKDRSLPDAGVLDPDTQYVVIEGNYLLLDQPVWREVKKNFDLTIFLSTPIQELDRRLLNRWTRLGFSQEQATLKVNSNDLVNAKFVLSNSLKANLVIQ